MTTPSNYFNEPGKDNESTSEIIINTEKEYRINKFLKAVPHLEITPTGISNIAKRFGASEDVINSLIEETRKG